MFNPGSNTYWSIENILGKAFNNPGNIYDYKGIDLIKR